MSLKGENKKLVTFLSWVLITGALTFLITLSIGLGGKGFDSQHALQTFSFYLSGGIYLSVPEGGGQLYFRDPRPGAMLTPATPFQSEWYHNIHVTEDLLVLFFPFLEHGTFPGTQTTDRIMLSFDVQLGS